MPSLLEPHAVHPADHVVQFYESDADLLERAGTWLCAGEVTIVIATEAHRGAFEARLRDARVECISLDAAETLQRLMRAGHIDRDAFFDVVGRIVRVAAATGLRVRAYGEMVALLWEAGDVMAAIELETLWNELAAEVPFSLYCAYRSESVAGHEHAGALAQVCHLHSAVVPTPVAETTWHFLADATAPRHARRRVIDALRRAGHDAVLLDDVGIAITELATNAIVHARSPFSVTLCSTGSRVRVAVRDGSHAAPVMREDHANRPSGRGVPIVAALAGRWGVTAASGGKDVWAEFGV